MADATWYHVVADHGSLRGDKVGQYATLEEATRAASAFSAGRWARAVRVFRSTRGKLASPGDEPLLTWRNGQVDDEVTLARRNAMADWPEEAPSAADDLGEEY